MEKKRFFEFYAAKKRANLNVNINAVKLWAVVNKMVLLAARNLSLQNPTDDSLELIYLHLLLF